LQVHGTEATGDERLAQAFAFFMQGSMAEEAGEPDRALTFYLKSLAADPSNVVLGLKVSSEHVRRGDTSEAVDLLKSVIKAAPQEPQPMRNTCHSSNLARFSWASNPSAGGEWRR
jgi:predicted Zn-dependent protease